MLLLLIVFISPIQCYSSFFVCLSPTSYLHCFSLLVHVLSSLHYHTILHPLPFNLINASTGYYCMVQLLQVVLVCAMIASACAAYGAQQLRTGPQVIAQPAGSIVITPGTDLSSVISGKKNQVYWLKAGTHTTNGNTVLMGDGNLSSCLSYPLLSSPL